ncbi:hypothetical protein DW133_03930 [Sutterella sp. AM11-39]|jgi:hypothetical protein|nr:hypothetical protein DW133_03930 [Sutterella sp. AM11-39]
MYPFVEKIQKKMGAMPIPNPIQHGCLPQFFSSEKLIAADNIARALEWEFQKILTSKARRGLYSFFFEIQGFSTKISSTNSSNFT